MKWKKWDLSSEGFLRIVPFAVAIASIHHPDSYRQNGFSASANKGETYF